jgi:Arc/MetJ family transcription regulator
MKHKVDWRKTGRSYRFLSRSTGLLIHKKIAIFVYTSAIFTMRTNIDLNDQLVQQALELSHAKTKKEVVELALQNFVKSLQRQQLLTLRGTIQWEGDLDVMRQS